MTLPPDPPPPGDYRDDPAYLLAEACYRFPDADDAATRDALRLEAVLEMRAIQRRHESA